MLSKDEKKVIVAILEGADHPRSMKEVARLVNLDTRTVRAIVHDLNVKDPIGASRHQPAGYFWATSDDELELALRPLASQTREIQRRLAGLRRAKAISKDEALAEPTSDDKKAKEA
ncbi:hypothetical protein [Limosilactobacillus fermentum]|uniref:hypothetical protein n=1 Tax=Limosilactobacillus fermentum TaxID=1613 RepID=UPI000ED7A21C|nr:hypothetical protein [Limosilactobacillus fermentum]RGW54277.1 hypothetical protein DWV65_08640 [Limosilactobacillus fermentum]